MMRSLEQNNDRTLAGAASTQPGLACCQPRRGHTVPAIPGVGMYLHLDRMSA